MFERRCEHEEATQSLLKIIALEIPHSKHLLLFMSITR